MDSQRTTSIPSYPKKQTTIQQIETNAAETNAALCFFYLSNLLHA